MRNYEKISIFIFMLLFNLVTFAQPGDDTADGDLEGPDAVPLNNKIILFSVLYLYRIAITYAFQHIQSK